MSTQKDDAGTDAVRGPEDLKAKLMRPLTVTAPTYAFIVAGIAALALLFAAID